MPENGGEVLRPFDLLARGVGRLASGVEGLDGVATLSIAAVRGRFPVKLGFSTGDLEALSRQEVSLQVDFYLEDDAAWDADEEAAFLASDGRAWVDSGRKRVLVDLGEDRDGTAIRDALKGAEAAMSKQAPRALVFDMYARELGNDVLLTPAELRVLGDLRLDLCYVLMPAPAP